MWKWIKKFFCCFTSWCRKPRRHWCNPHQMDERFYDDLIDDESQYH